MHIYQTIKKYFFNIRALGLMFFVLVGLVVSMSGICATLRPSRSALTESRVVSGSIPDTSTRGTVRVIARTTNNNQIVQKNTVDENIYTRQVRARTNTSENTGVLRTRNSADVNGILINSLGTEFVNICKEQYSKCMDNFCNVLDKNLGRCSCSENLKNYARTEDGLKQANEKLQDIAQKIQYIGLSKEEIETLFTQTAAELAMQSQTDNTQLKNDLDKIKDLIVDVQSGKTISSGGGVSLDLSGLLNFDVNSADFDLNSLFENRENNFSISNQRGKQLYQTATQRCQAAVLNNCAAHGVDKTLITNSYDMEIDRQCIMYERYLTDANVQMINTVRNATVVLQKARLMVAQQKNSYDLRQCVTELDICMQDDFVCGTDYKNCLDTTGKFIVNGEIILYTDPDAMMTMIWGSNSPSSNYEFIKKYATSGLVKSLLDKIGDPIKKTGMCYMVLNKCQSQWEDKESSEFDMLNQVSLAYLENIIPKIIMQQKELFANYVSECKQNVDSCMNAAGGVGNVVPNTTQSVMDFLKSKIGACRKVIDSCTSSLKISTKELLTDWIRQNICEGYDVTNDVCSLEEYNTIVRNCRNNGNLWIDGVCLDSTDYYESLVGTYPEVPDYCLLDIGDMTPEKYKECSTICYNFTSWVNDEFKPINDKGMFVLASQCKQIGWVPEGVRENSEFFCAFKGCRYSTASRCIQGYTKISELKCGNTTLDWVCCPSGQIDECKKQICENL